MYLGKIVEYGDKTEDLRGAPSTRTPRRCCRRRPTSTSRAASPPKERIRLVGDVPSPIDPPSGCRFRTRCWKAQDICATTGAGARLGHRRRGDRPSARVACTCRPATSPRSRPTSSPRSRPDRRQRDDVCRWAGSRTGAGRRHTRGRRSGVRIRFARSVRLKTSARACGRQRRRTEHPWRPEGTQAAPGRRWGTVGDWRSARSQGGRGHSPRPAAARRRLGRACASWPRRPRGMSEREDELRTRSASTRHAAGGGSLTRGTPSADRPPTAPRAR